MYTSFGSIFPSEILAAILIHEGHLQEFDDSPLSIVFIKRPQLYTFPHWNQQSSCPDDNLSWWSLFTGKILIFQLCGIWTDKRVSFRQYPSDICLCLVWLMLPAIPDYLFTRYIYKNLMTVHYQSFSSKGHNRFHTKTEPSRSTFQNSNPIGQ